MSYFILATTLWDAPILLQPFVARRKGIYGYDFLLAPWADNKIGSVASEINIGIWVNYRPAKIFFLFFNL